MTELSQDAEVIEQFFGVYLLYCLNPRYCGRTYIGYTCDPNKRINQHNSGVRAGGARRTHSKGPWEMVLIVHGFHSSVSALRFEWAWQHPKSFLTTNARKKYKETYLQHAIRVLFTLLGSTPWCKLPLTIRWISEKYMNSTHTCQYPPAHMPIVYGPIVAKKLAKKLEAAKKHENSDGVECYLCHDEVCETHSVQCIRPTCLCVFHLVCLARNFIGNNESLLPVEGKCPACDLQVLWGDLIRKKCGCVDFEDSVTICLEGSLSNDTEISE